MRSAGTPIRDLLAIVTVAACVYLLAILTIQAVHVVGSSMNPSLQNDDLVLASRVDYRLHPPERGDIVIVRDPYDPSQNFIKRVIGVPGDHLLIRAARVYIDGVRLQEPYVAVNWRTTANWPSLPDQPDGVVIPPGEYFVMGDNRDHSSDSRLFGYVGAGQIEGKAILRFWPVAGIELLGARPSLAAGA